MWAVLEVPVAVAEEVADWETTGRMVAAKAARQ
jgi:hypothetical protein